MDTDQQVVWDILSTPSNISHREYRKRYKLTWLTRERRVLRISGMSTDHIIKCINMLERAGQLETQAYQGLIAEMQKRLGEYNGARME
jgi:predicted metal-dependent peptidase